MPQILPRDLTLETLPGSMRRTTVTMAVLAWKRFQGAAMQSPSVRLSAQRRDDH